MTTYSKRLDGRKFDELREITAKVGVIPRANGSAMFTMGDTVAYAAVYGPRKLHPKFLQNPETGILRCNYDMLSFSVPERKKPGPTRRSVEISLITRNALLPSINIESFPNSVIDVYIQILQANAGTRCAGICAASLALADAGIPLKDLVSAVSVGKIGDKIVVDLDKEEEDFEGGSTDIPFAMMPRTEKITLLQLDGSLLKSDFAEALNSAKKACQIIYKEQQKAIREHYQGERYE